MLTLTESAQRHFRRLIEQQGIAGLGVRMQAVHPGTPKADCRLEFCEASDLSGGEWSLACEGFSLYVDAQSMPYLDEALIDFSSDATGGQLIVRAPKLKGNPPPADAEWAFMMTGCAECLDSFFAFGLFEVARRSGFFPEALVETFEPVIQEEARHILFFVNWLAWHRRQLALPARLWFNLRCFACFLGRIKGRIDTAFDVKGKEGDRKKDKNFTATTSKAKFESSPTVADGKLYITNFWGEVYVVKTGGDQFEQLSVNEMGNGTKPNGDAGSARSSIAVANGCLFIRTQDKLYCVGK